MKPKILFFAEIETPYRQPVLHELCLRDKWDLRVVLLTQKQRNRSWELPPLLVDRTDLLPGFELFSRNAYTLYVNWGVSDYLVKQKPSVVLICGYAQHAFWKAAQFCLKNKIPYITVTESHLYKKRSSWLQKMKKTYVEKFYKNASAHLVMGSRAREFIESYGASSNGIFEFPNTIHVPNYTAKVDQLRNAKTNSPANRPLAILYVGHLEPWKGCDLLIQAFELVSKKLPNIELHMIGDGSERKNLEKMAAQLLHGKVHFHGFVQPDLLPRYFSESNLLVLPSRHETWGVVLIEAMASRLPIIASKAVGAAPDLIVEGKTGYTFQTENVEDLAEKIFQILSSDSKRIKMGEEANILAKQWSTQKATLGFESAFDFVVRKMK